MSDPFLGEIRMFAGTYVPQGWLLCDGRVLPIQQPYTALFALIRNTYGGDGKTNFALPDLRGRVPMHAGAGTNLTLRVLGKAGGNPSVTLDWTQLPIHTHTPFGQAAVGNAANPTGGVWAETAQTGTPKASSPLYDAGPANVQMNPAALASVGGGAAHNNMQPYLGMNLCIAMTGIWPPRS